MVHMQFKTSMTSSNEMILRIAALMPFACSISIVVIFAWFSARIYRLLQSFNMLAFPKERILKLNKYHTIPLCILCVDLFKGNLPKW